MNEDKIVINIIWSNGSNNERLIVDHNIKLRDILPKSKKKYIMVSTEDNEIVSNLLKYDLDKTLRSIDYLYI